MEKMCTNLITLTLAPKRNTNTLSFVNYLYKLYRFIFQAKVDIHLHIQRFMSQLFSFSKVIAMWERMTGGQQDRS
jgi:hypothetical protein